MKFNGTALPNKSIEIVIEDPLGKEIISDIIQIDDSGIIEFEFETTQNSSEGTYTLIATQNNDKEFIYAGLGQLPTIPVNLEFDKLSYKSGETAIITLSGKASEIISLLIIDPSDKPAEDPISISLQPDGRGTHSIDLKGYSIGVYTAVISKGSTQSTEVFTVGLQTGSGEIKINTTKTQYNSGDSILILGDTAAPNVLLTLTMINPNGDEIKIKETFSDKNGKISEDSFRIPSDAISGTWKINAKSGANFANIEIEVLAVVQEGMVIQVEEGQDIPGFGKTINIHVFGAKQTVTIDIFAEDGEIIEELSFPASDKGEINQPWIIPSDTEPGTYTIKVADAFNDAETTFEIQWYQTILFQLICWNAMNLEDKISEYANFPKKGILFRDFSPILKDPSALSFIADEFSKYFHPKDIDIFAGIESRGFILASILASRYNKGMIMIRKAGKLPGKTTKLAYTIEYGKDTIEIQKDIIKEGERILICDDLLATGGTAKASAKLIEKSGGKISGFAFIIELTDLNGIKGISKYNCKSLVKYWCKKMWK